MAKLSKAELKRKLKQKTGLEYERHFLLCTGSNCQPEIAARTERFLGKRLNELGAKNRCHVTAVECLKLCRSGPIALVYPEGTYYCEVTPEKCARILDEHIMQGKPVEEFAFATVSLMAAPVLQKPKLEANKMADDFKKGDAVEWDSSGGHSTGKVVEKVTETAKVKGHTAKATKDEPQFKVKSDKSGKTAIHKPEELKKAKK